jgi:predicted nucleotidyltransferase
MGKVSTLKPVQEFCRRASRDWRLERVILFGSRARGDARPDSDWDVVIVSPDFAGIKFRERMRRLYKYWDYAKYHALEPLPYTPEEFEKKANQISIVREAVREGIDVE